MSLYEEIALTLKGTLQACMLGRDAETFKAGMPSESLRMANCSCRTMVERSGRCGFPVPGLPYLLPSLSPDDGSPFPGLLDTREDQLEQPMSTSGIWEQFPG